MEGEMKDKFTPANKYLHNTYRKISGNKLESKVGGLDKYSKEILKYIARIEELYDLKFREFDTRYNILIELKEFVEGRRK